MAAGDSPLKQFVINDIAPFEVAGIDASFTNASLWMVIAVVLSGLLFIVSIQGRSLIPGRAQSVAELYYEFVHTMVRNGVGSDGMKFFPFVFTLFTFILTCNLLGMIPGSFTVTSHIIVTFALALLVMLIVILYGIWKNGIGFFKLFVPDVPPWLLPLLIPIEIISFLARPISLSVRLFANMLAGHITLKVFAGFVVGMASLGGLGVIGAVLPLLLTFALTMLEFLIAFLQAFVFATLTCMYLHDALHPGH